MDNSSLCISSVDVNILSVDAKGSLRYVRWCTDFKGFSFNMEVAPSCLKHIKSVLPEFTVNTYNY